MATPPPDYPEHVRQFLAHALKRPCNLSLTPAPVPTRAAHNLARVEAVELYALRDSKRAALLKADLSKGAEWDLAASKRNCRIQPALPDRRRPEWAVVCPACSPRVDWSSPYGWLATESASYWKVKLERRDFMLEGWLYLAMHIGSCSRCCTVLWMV